MLLLVGCNWEVMFRETWDLSTDEVTWHYCCWGRSGELMIKIYVLDPHFRLGEPICCRTLSSHWSGPLRWTSIQQGVAVTVFLLYSSPQPLTNEILEWEKSGLEMCYFNFLLQTLDAEGSHSFMKKVLNNNNSKKIFKKYF